MVLEMITRGLFFGQIPVLQIDMDQQEQMSLC